jgi:hypothetical protein
MLTISDWFSQTRAVRTREERGLHPVNELSRFTILVCGLFCGICVSLTYAYDLFTTQFRDQFQLSAGDLSTVSTVGLVFCYLLLPYSLLFEPLGPFVNFMICMVTGVVGTVCLALTFSGTIPGNTATITVFYAFLNTASGLIDTTYISTLFEVFPRNRGPVVCLAKVMTGLGSTIFACLSTTLFKDDIVGFIYFLCAVIAAVSLCAGFVIVLPPYYMNWWRRQGKSKKEIAALETLKALYHHKSVPMQRLIIGYVVVITLILFFTIETPVVAYVSGVSRSSEIGIGVAAVVMTLCLFLMVLPLRCLGGIDEPAPTEEEVRAVNQLYTVPHGLSSSNNSSDNNSNSEGKEATLEKPTVVAATEAAVMDNSLTMSESPADEEGTASEAHQDPRYQGNTVIDYFKSLDLWLILLYMFCVAPMGIMVSYNGSTISVAKTGKPRSTQTAALYTAFLGLGNSVGRMAFGLLEAYVQHQRGRGGKLLVTSALFVCPVIAAVGGVLLLVLPGKVILLPYILVYIMNGFNAALQALIFTCLFERFHNTLYNMGFLVTVVCVVCFNRLLFGMYVDRQHDRLGLTASQECNTEGCIRVPFIVATCLAAAGLLFAGLVHVRYARYVARVRRQSAKKAATTVSVVDDEPFELQEVL